MTITPAARFRLLAAGVLLLALCSALNAQIAFYGDTQGNHQVHSGIVQGILRHSPGLAFHLGDLTVRGSKQKEYDSFFAAAAPLVESCPLYPARGNHDRSLELFLANFPRLGGSSYYAVEQDSLLFLVLDSTQDLMPGSAQYAWLSAQLREGRPLGRFVLLHHPLFSSGYQGGDEELRLFLPALFASSGVVAVFSGHDHDYERSEYRGVTYFVSGGAGGVLRPPRKENPPSQAFANTHHYLILHREGNILTCSAYGLDGQLLDSVQLTLPTP